MPLAVNRRSLVARRFLADFDSGVAFLLSTAAGLERKPVRSPMVPPRPRGVAAVLGGLPEAGRRAAFTGGARLQGVPHDLLRRYRAEEVSAWMVGRYRGQRYPGVFVGAASGAVAHLAVALGMPWLPQTHLLPVRQTGVPLDEPRAALAAGRQLGANLLADNPELQLHHMHDPNQDRPMLASFMYFRLKRLRLGDVFSRFIRDCVEPGGTIVIVNSERVWPQTRVGERHLFQFGALGGATREEYFEGSDRVRRFLERAGSPVRRWDPPEADEDAPEAEWGFSAALRDDLEQLAREGGFRLRTLRYVEPEHPSPLVADLHREWYRRRGVPAQRLLVESYVPVDPYLALRSGSVPFWMKFNMQPSADWLRAYLDASEPYDEIHLGAFSPGLEPVGLVGIEEWRGLLGRARRRGAFIGMNEAAYPTDPGYLQRFRAELERLPAQHSVPASLTVEDVERFLTASGRRHQVELDGASRRNA